jgi:hypothetical protein
VKPTEFLTMMSILSFLMTFREVNHGQTASFSIPTAALWGSSICFVGG